MMKKILFATGTLAVIAAGLYAASDRIVITDLNNVITSIFVDDVDQISFVKTDASAEGYDRMKVTAGENGKDSDFAISEISKMEYVKALPDLPGTVDVTPSYRCVTFNVTMDDPNLCYRVGLIEASKLEGLTENEWDDVIFKEEEKDLKATATEAGYSLSDYPTESVFPFKGDFEGQWFGAVNYDYDLKPGGNYVAYAYAGINTSDGLKQTHAFTKIPVTLKQIEYQDVAFQIDADMHSNRITFKVDCPQPDIRYAIDMFSADDVDAYGVEPLVNTAIAQREQLVYNYGYSWDDVTFCGHGENTYNNLRVGDTYYCVTYGLEFGERNTVIVSKQFTVPSAEIADNCTFDVVTSQKAPSEMELTVTPSNEGTRYAAILCEGSELETKTAEKIIADKIYFLNVTNNIDWSDSKMIYTGTQTISTLDGVINGQNLNVGTEYAVLIFGVDETGERTTVIKEVKFKTVSQQVDNLTFTIEFGNFDTPSDYTHYQPVKVTPSDPNAKYVFDNYKSSDSVLSKTDDEFVNWWVSSYGSNLKLLSGENQKNIGFSSWGSWEPYLIFVFGYDGEKTSELYLYSIDTEDGTVTQLRGPGTPQDN